MKTLIKILYFSILYLIIGTTSANATNITVNPYSEPITFGNKLSQHISLTITAGESWKLFIQPLSKALYNQISSNSFIPTNRLELMNNNGVILADFSQNKAVEINSSDFINPTNINLSFNLITLGNDRPGTYTIPINFICIDNHANRGEAIYYLRFTREEICSIDFSEPILHMQPNKEKLLRKDITQKLENPLSIYIKSNKDWKLYLKKLSGTSSPLTYYIQPLYADNSITLNKTGEYLQMSENPILIASGKATFNDTTQTLDRKIINIDYQIKGPDGKFIPAGQHYTYFQYDLKTED